MYNYRRLRTEEQDIPCNSNIHEDISNSLTQPILNVADVSSSNLLQPSKECSHVAVPNICSHPNLRDSSIELTSAEYNSSEPQRKNAAQYSKSYDTNKLGDPSMKTPHLLFQFPPQPQPQHLDSRLAPPVNTKPRTRSETSMESAGRLLSPVSSSRKYVKVISSPVSAGKRRGSESVLDETSRSGSQYLQTDLRWEKLRSILVAMRNEPADTETILSSSSQEMLNNLQEKISTQKDQFTLQGKLSYLHDALKQKETEVQQAEAERDSALAYIRHLKANLTDTGDKNSKLYEQGIDSLRASNVSKENVVDMLSPLVKKLHEQKSYLDCLMTVVLMRAPWMLDEVDKMELPKNQRTFNCSEDVEGDDFQYEDSDNEVWC